MNPKKSTLFFALFIVSIFLVVPFVTAQDLTFSLDQTEYYFKIGEEAIITLKTNNTYGDTINGLLGYTITQNINQGNLQYSSSNSKSTSFSVGAAESDIRISFGTSDSPSTLNVDLKFTYTQNESRIVNLKGIKIHFVEDENQKNNQQNQVSSSSESKESSNSQQNSQNNAASQQQNAQQSMQQTIQQMLDELTQNQQQASPSAQQKLQNNQMAQDSSALKQQMMNQLKEQQQLKQEFQNELGQNQDFLKEHQDLLNQGYNLTGGSLNPSSNNTGDFELNYQKSDGSQASMTGQLNEGNLENLQKNTPESRQRMLDKLQENKDFQEYKKQLQEQGYSQQNTEFTQEVNKTSIQMNYLNDKNETAIISAEIVNENIKNVELKSEENTKKNTYLWILIVVIILVIIGIFIYFKFKKKKISLEQIPSKKILMSFNYKLECKKMLSQAKELFEKKQYKDAYGKAGQSLRTYLSYENNLNKEITNDELIDFFIKNKIPYKDTKQCFDLCSLVEFAKYAPNKKDFEKIVNYVQKVINK